MAAAPLDPICVRNSHLQHILLGRRQLFEDEVAQRQLTKDGLIDALLVLYDDCNTEKAKKDISTTLFVDKYEPVVNKLKKLRVNKADFEQRKVIGRGHFGEVHLVKEIQTGDVYAMKVMKKSTTLAKHNITFYEEEKDIMAKAKSEWLTSLHCSFQDQENLYLVMEFHPGGDLLSLLGRRDGGTLSEEEARFYIAEVILALHSLHSMGYVHRDIKPENILLDRLGHIKLADFGSAAKLDSSGFVRNEMPVGTADYIAPEVLTSLNNVGLLAGGYRTDCDFWSLGIMAYEMVYGSTPFGDEKTTTTYGNIMNFKNSLQFPKSKNVSKDFLHLISNLLCDSKSRLGYNDLIKHPFFTNIDWNSLRENSPPYVPTVSSLDDTSNFDDFVDDAASRHSYSSTFSDINEHTSRDLPFIGFTFVKEKTPYNFDPNITEGNSQRHLESELKLKTKEVIELRKRLLALEQEESKQWRTDLLQQKVNRLETERDTLEKQQKRALRDVENLKRNLDLEKAERQMTEAKTVELVKDIKRNWEKISDNEKKALTNEIQVWKDISADHESKQKETAELLKSAMAAIAKLEKECDVWKAKSIKYKEIAARGQRMVEKRCSINLGPSSEVLAQTQLLLEKERKLKGELNEQVRTLEHKIKHNEKDFTNQLSEEKSQWMVNLASKEADHQLRLKEFEQEILEKDKQIKVLKSKLEIHSCETQQLEKRIELLQKNSEESFVWKAQYELNFSLRENEFKDRISQMESEIRALSKKKHDLQEQISESSFREAQHLQKYEAMMVKMQEAVEKMEMKNQDLSTKLSTVQCSTVVSETEELKQKTGFLESQLVKVEQQLEKSRENLTLEREKSRQLQSDVWKKEKELSDVKIDLRIVNREMKTIQTQMSKSEEEHKDWESKIKTKEEEISLMKEEQTKIQKQLEDSQQLVAEKEKQVAELRSNLEDMKKATETVRDLQREIKSLKDDMTMLQRQKTTIESEFQRAEERIHRSNEEKADLQERFTELKAKAAVEEKNFNLLKETCSVMDDQLKAFENMIECSEKRQKEVDSDKSKLAEEMEKLKQELRSAKQQTNEEKSLKLFSESKLRDVESRLANCEQEMDSRIGSIKSQSNEYASMVKNLTEKVTDLDQQLADSELSISSISRRINVLEEENIKLKEESTALRTQLISVKNSNVVLSEGLEEAISKAEKYKTTISQLENQMETTKVMHKERELKLEATVGQQTKLIDFLQCKTEVKKKVTLSDKLFGSHKKESQPIFPVAYRELESNLEKKNIQCRSLMEQLNKCKSELAIAKAEHSSKNTVGKEAGRVLTEHTRNVSVTPLPHRALSRLTQSPGTQGSPTNTSSGLAAQRMHHNIPHRLQSQMVRRATNCAVCLDSIHFGRQVSTCQDCGASAHVKCTAHLPSTCGLPVGLAEHFDTVMGQENVSCIGETDSSGSFQMQGWVKIPRSAKGCWDRKYMKLNDSKLCIYDCEPTSETVEPIDSIDLRPGDGSTVAVHSAVAHSEVLSTAKTDLPYIFMVEMIPLTTCWPGRNLFVMTLNFPDKKAWVKALEGVAQEENSRSSLVHPKPNLVLRLENAIDVNCVVTISEGVLLIGAEEGLFSYHVNNNQRKDLVRIDGVANVQQIVLVPKLSAVLMIVGVDRQLVMTELRVLQGCAGAAQCAKPTLSVEPLPNSEDCHLFSVSNLAKDDIFLCVATQDRVKLLKWNGSVKQFVLRKELIVSETCSCIHFTEHSVLVGCDRFYEVDLGDYTVEEFLDASDSTLAYVVFGLKQIHSFPVAILDVTTRKGDPEFLLCYHEFGIFVDGYGRRSRPDDVKWTRLPLAFAYRGPYLFVLHFNSVEVMHLTKTSFTHKTKAEGSNLSNTSQESVLTPPSIFVEMPSPRYLGPAPNVGSNYFFTNNNDVMDIVTLEAPSILGDKLKTEFQPDEVSLSGSEFSITSSMAHILDQSDHSVVSSNDPNSSPLKRLLSNQSSRNADIINSNKRVKFESDL